MKITNVYRMPSSLLQIHRFEFTTIKSVDLNNSFILINTELHASTAHTLHRYLFLTKVIPYENITD